MSLDEEMAAKVRRMVEQTAAWLADGDGGGGGSANSESSESSESSEGAEAFFDPAPDEWGPLLDVAAKLAGIAGAAATVGQAGEQG